MLLGAGGSPAGDVAPPPSPPYACEGRMLWFIVSAITLTSPLLILLTQVSSSCVWGGGRYVGMHQAPSRSSSPGLPHLACTTACVQRWVRPGPHDFTRLAAAREGESYDVNAADPTGLLADVYEAGLLPPPPPLQLQHDAERGGAGKRRSGAG